MELGVDRGGTADRLVLTPVGVGVGLPKFFKMGIFVF